STGSRRRAGTATDPPERSPPAVWTAASTARPDARAAFDARERRGDRRLSAMRTVGVEEEYLLVGPDGAPTGVAEAALAAYEERVGSLDGDGPEPGGGLEPELQQEQLETGTRPCRSLTSLAAEV